MNTETRFSRILVTDAYHLAGLGAVRSLARAGYSVTAGYAENQERPAGAWSRYWTSDIRYPDPKLRQLEFRSWLHDEAKRGNFDAVLPVSEASVAAVAAVRDKLPDAFLPILPDNSSLRYTLSKHRSTQLALSLGVTCPRTLFVSSGEPADRWNRDLSNLRFPIVIKIDNCLTEEGIYETGRKFFAANATEALSILKDLEDIKRGIIAQEFIPGHGTAAFLLRFNGKIHMTFAHRRLHEVPYTGGVSSFRKGIEDEELVKISAGFLDAINYNGLAMVEFRRSREDGRPYFLEINGRLWGSLALALHSGVDFPKALIECYEAGAPASPQTRYQPGIRCRNVFRGELSHLISILKARSQKAPERPPSKIRAVAKFIALSLNPMIRHDYFWWSDPLPGFVQMGRTLRWVVVKAFEKLANRWRGRKLKQLRSEHHRRCAQGKYFRSLPSKVLFLCYGNICRSPLAEHLWNARVQQCRPNGPIAVSAGFHPCNDRKPPAWVIELAAEHGVNLSKHRSRMVTKSLVDSADMIFLMDQRNYRDLMSRFPSAKDKTYFLGLFADNNRIEISDPFGRSKAEAHACYEHVLAATMGLMSRVLDDRSSPAFLAAAREAREVG